MIVIRRVSMHVGPGISPEEAVDIARRSFEVTAARVRVRPGRVERLELPTIETPAEISASERSARVANALVRGLTTQETEKGNA